MIERMQMKRFVWLHSSHDVKVKYDSPLKDQRGNEARSNGERAEPETALIIQHSAVSARQSLFQAVVRASLTIQR